MPLDIDDLSLLQNYSSTTKKFSLSGYKAFAKCVYVYDGDTIHVVFKMPYTNNFFKWIIRLSYIDTPEIKTQDIVEHQKAIIARDFLHNKIFNKIIVIQCQDFDKYGRLLATIFINENDTVSINQEMINNGYAQPYDGKTKQKNEIKIY